MDIACRSSAVQSQAPGCLDVLPVVLKVQDSGLSVSVRLWLSVYFVSYVKLPSKALAGLAFLRALLDGPQVSGGDRSTWKIRKVALRCFVGLEAPLAEFRLAPASQGCWRRSPR